MRIKLRSALQPACLIKVQRNFYALVWVKFFISTRAKPSSSTNQAELPQVTPSCRQSLIYVYRNNGLSVAQCSTTPLCSWLGKRGWLLSIEKTPITWYSSTIGEYGA